MTKFTVTYQATRDVEAPDRGEAIAQIRDQEPEKVQIISVLNEAPTGQYL